MHDSWFRTASVYAVDLSRFQDSNGDGIGDLQGVISRLDYLADLGFTALWILPFHPSPMRDNGYDVADYMSVSDRFGDLADIRDLVTEAHRRGMRVVFDLVVHHTSDQHPWFQSARSRPDSPYRDYYIWSETKPTENQPEPIFPGVETSVWEWDSSAEAYFFHLFYRFQPDLNFANPRVQQEILDIASFWMEFGIDGFRLDAANHLFEEKGLPGTSCDRPCEFLARLLQIVRAKNPEAVLIAEADIEGAGFDDLACDGVGITIFVNFLLNNYLYLALARESAQPLLDGLNVLPELPPSCGWLNFLRNLDEIDLERLNEAERDEVFAVFAPDKNMQIYDRGIRRRIAPMLDGQQLRLRMAMSLLFAHSGTPMLVYGDEIGMGDNLSLPERVAVHLPMQWSSEEHGGFTTAPLRDIEIAPVADGEFGYRKVNVAQQEQDPESLLSHVRNLQRCRAAHPILSKMAEHNDTLCEGKVLRSVRHHDGAQFMVLHNFSRHTQHRVLESLPPATQLLVCDETTALETDQTLTVGPYGYCWLTLPEAAAERNSDS
jgi:maltose alpha-D-glucosyltransferase/alpha-amylase